MNLSKRRQELVEARQELDETIAAIDRIMEHFPEDRAAAPPEPRVKRSRKQPTRATGTDWHALMAEAAEAGATDWPSTWAYAVEHNIPKDRKDRFYNAYWNRRKQGTLPSGLT